MKAKTIGILGGMGPEATLDIFRKIIENTPARKDQDHIHIIINNNPKIPDRTAAYLGNGCSPVPDLIDGCKVLERSGADFVIIPCVSAHIFLEEIQAETKLPIVSIFDAVANAIKKESPRIETVGLMATDSTVQANRFQDRLNFYGLKVVTPGPQTQDLIMKTIYRIKNTDSTHPRAKITSKLIEAAESLIYKSSDKAQGIIAGCTEIPLALKQKHLSVPFFDSLDILATEAIQIAQNR